jgi:predicted DNA-binding transcriptional regulator YafY
MPYNKNALLRYRILDACFSNFNKKYFIADLINSCSEALSEIAMTQIRVSRRQIFLDMEYMKSIDGWTIPLSHYKEGKKTYYRYSDQIYTIQNSPLQHHQFQLLQDTLELLSSVNGIPETNQFIPILEKITHSKNIEIQSLVSYQANENQDGMRWYSLIFQSLRNKKVLKIEYKSFNQNEKTTYTLHPYHLKQYNNRWFLFGLNESFNIPTWNSPIDRIIDIEITDITFKENTQIDFNFYFEDIIGVTIYKDAQIESVKLEVMAPHTPYVISKPLHPSQKKIEELHNGNLIFQLKIIPNQEFYTLLMSNIDKYRILSPEIVRQELILRLDAGLKLNR